MGLEMKSTELLFSPHPMDCVFRVIQWCDNSIVLFSEASLPLNILCFTVVSSLLKAVLVSYQVLFILQEGEWVGCCKSMRGAASQHLQMCG